MTLDEFEYLTRNFTPGDGREVCFHMANGVQIIGTISKLARYNQRVIGVELSYAPPSPSEDSIPAIAEPPDFEADLTSTVFVPASTVNAAEWVSRD